MGRYRNEFGSVVNVDDELAARIGEKWEPVPDDSTSDEVKRSPGRPKKSGK